ncbi:MAG: type II toxin-antitoxin system death-on-curing family toxin [Chloroflexi bacterium]|nr:type II toxin-antitoxin system death-on-curing family toxin [Chloroflexota bacterium]
MPRLVYLEREDVDIVVRRLAGRLFEGYDDPPLAFTLLGAQGSALLDSALTLPKQPYYRTIYDKAAVLLRSMIKNHPFLDGNKRAAVTSVIVFLLFNNRFLVSSQEELVQFALEVAQSEPDMDWRPISNWIRARTITLHPVSDENMRRLLAIQPDINLPALRDRLIAVMDALGDWLWE